MTKPISRGWVARPDWFLIAIKSGDRVRYRSRHCMATRPAELGAHIATGVKAAGGQHPGRSLQSSGMHGDAVLECDPISRKVGQLAGRDHDVHA